MKHIEITDVNRKGDLAEYYAITWLWDKGFEVFKNCGCTGIVDLIAVDKNFNTKFIDVKTFIKDTRWNGTWTTVSSQRTAEQIEQGIQLLGYNPESRKLRFVEHKS